jgi:threonine dehydrogenase-like Zn-dependent dehydrogenase
MTAAREALVAELPEPQRLVWRREAWDPDSLEPSAVAARTVYSAISPGTEVAAWRGDPPLRPMKAYPRVVGYCNVARVVTVGTAVDRVAPGDLILTFQSHRSAFVCSQENVILTLPSEADPVSASTTYLFHLGYNALLRGGYRPGLYVAVVGLGTLGLSTVAVARAHGARVLGLSGQPALRRLAAEMGAAVALAKDDPNLPERIDDLTRGVGLDLVVLTSNRWADWRLAVSLPRPGGRVAVLGFPGRGQPPPDFNPLDSQFFYDRQLSLIACGYAPDLDVPARDVRFTIKRNCRALLDLIVSGALPAGRLVGQVVEWSRLEEVYRRLDGDRGELLTGVLSWE